MSTGRGSRPGWILTSSHRGSPLLGRRHEFLHEDREVPGSASTVGSSRPGTALLDVIGDLAMGGLAVG